ncbi:MAG: 16S rRNA (cytosine(1402)-N(4))-methyltransferase RsmH [Candidatus Nealsonbacteria bacterium]|nr:16S rRNA (cytosine(1402)-N(4))-methyltransferase RsmH [Candidatus Nealsonbacteria bacterium]
MHKSVLKKEVIEYLDPEPNENFVDATLGKGGHALAILEATKPEGKVLGIELTPHLYKKMKDKGIDRLIVENDSYIHLKGLVKKHNLGPVAGILFDLGFSSWHLEESEKGFSFQRDEPLDMRYNEDFTELTASKIINEWPEEEIIKILKKYGQERFSKSITKKIAEERKTKKISTTSQLVEIIKEAVPSWYRYRKKHFATKTFQALRITVNNELKNLEQSLPQAREVLKKGGRMVVISFHSLEDKIVKNYFKENARKGFLKIITKKPVRPTKKEIIRNPRSRSAKLRAAIKI